MGCLAYNVSMHLVYIIQSINCVDQIYVGITVDIKHNSGGNKHTVKYKPWKIVWFCAFPSKKKAAEFEKYLKSSSGIAFRRKRLT